MSSAGVGVAGAMIHGCHALGTCGCVKVDDRGRGQMLEHRSHMEWVTDMGDGLPGCGDMWEWGSLDVSSVKYNSCR